MSDRSKPRIHSGVVFAALFAIFVLASCGGGSAAVGATTGNTPRSCSAIQNTTPTQPAISTIASAVSAAVASPYISGNTVQYYCDCTGAGQTCAAAGSIQGNDSTGSGAQTSPYQTIGAAMSWLNGGANRTVALCQGGSFTPPSTQGQFGFALAANLACPNGNICNELREYPIGGAGAKPIINNLSGNHYLFSTINGGGGYRFMNLKLQGIWDRTTTGNWGFFLYANAGLTPSPPPIHDIAIKNVDMDSFDLAVDDAVNSNSNITIVGNHFTNSSTWAYLGGSSNLTISYNSFSNNGSDNIYDHAIYFASHSPVTNVAIVGNFISGFSTASGNTNCIGSPFTGHAAVTNLTVSGNVVVEGTTADPRCYGIGFTNTTGAQGAIFLRNALFSDNIVVNGGAAGIAITSCPSCVIENNLVISQSNSGGAGITTPGIPARPQDDVECYAKVINNTIYYETTNVQGMNGGVVVGGEGAGYIVANNTVMYAGTSHSLNRTNCFNYSLPLASYSFINNNNCYSNDPSTNWVFGQTAYSLAVWQAYTATAGLSGTGFDTANTSTYANPGWSFATPLIIPALDEAQTGAQLFKSFFTPSAGSPLLGKGNNANAPATDITNTARSAASSIGAYQ